VLESSLRQITARGACGWPDAWGYCCHLRARGETIEKNRGHAGIRGRVIEQATIATRGSIRGPPRARASA